MRIKWIGPERSIKRLGIVAKPGDTFDVPAKVQLGGEGILWKKATKSKAKATKED